MNYKAILILLSTTFIFTACKKDKAAEKEVTTLLTCGTTSFASDVLPILNSYNCGSSGCHSTSSAQDGVRLTSYNEVNTVASSRLLGSIKHTAGFKLMPAGGGKLTPQEINTIECWINDGKQNN
jgi:hypothetical protein